MNKISDETTDFYPLTHAQKRIYYEEKLNPGTNWANTGFVVKYKEQLDLNLMARAINLVVKKNEGLRLRIVSGDMGPEQYVSPYKDVPIDIIDFSGPDGEGRFREWLDGHTDEPFHWDGDLFYWACIKFNDKESGYYQKIHHTVTDGWSTFLIFQEINKMYEALEAGEPVDESPNPSYLNYIADERTYLDSPQAQTDKAFWHETLLPLPPEAYLSTRKGTMGNARADHLVVTLPDNLRAKMHEFRKENKTSLYKLTLAALSIYVARATGLGDIVIGGVNHNRSEKSHHQIVGMFVSTISYRLHLDGALSFKDYVGYVGKNANHIVKNHQRYPYDMLAQELREESGRDIGYLRNISLVGHSDVEKKRFNYEYIFPKSEPGTILIHLNLANKDKDGVLELEWIYQVEHFSGSDIRRKHQGLVNVLTNALADPDRDISEIELLSMEEKQQVLYEFNHMDFRAHELVHELFESRVEKSPGNTALVYGGERLTYRQLNEKANRLARRLREKGVKPDHIVGLMMDRSLEMLIAILAVLKAGGAYLPVSPRYSEERRRYLLEDSECGLLLTQEAYVTSVDFEGEMLNLSQASRFQDNKLYKGENLDRVNSPGDLAYVIYTSGFRSEAHGVMIEHVSLMNAVVTLQRKYPVEDSDVFLFKTSYQFDVSVPEIFGWFLGGGRLAITENGSERDPKRILAKIEENRVTHINFTPTMFNQLVNILSPKKISRLCSLKYLFLSGEAVAPEMINRFGRLNPDVAIENLYGSVEISVYATAFSLSLWQGGRSIPIGTPVNNIRTYILNFSNQKPVILPVGIAGELCISGLGLARGYWKRSQLNGEKFIDNPFEDGSDPDSPYKKLYRTGELAQWLPDGEIEYLGPINRQVRVRGARINVTEIESKLLELPEIKEAVVIAREDEKGKYLCAYFVADESIDTAVERARLAESLPPHMMPAYFMQIEKIPLTTDGKANRMELLSPKHDPHVVEEKLMEIEAEVLHVNKKDIHLDDNFFKLGGHSYKAAQVASKIHKAFNVKVSMAELFKRPTLRQMSEFLTESLQVKYAAIEPAPPQEYYPQSSAQKRLYFLQQLEEENTTYNIQMMDIYCKGVEFELLEEAFYKLFERHESLRTSFHLSEGHALQKIHDFEEVRAGFKLDYYETDEEGKIYKVMPGKSARTSQLVGRDFQDVIGRFVRPFDLETPPLLRGGFIKILGNTKILMLDMHHIIADGISLELLAKELWELYDGKELPPLRLQYKDFSEWLNSENRVEAVKEQEEFWLREFAGEIPLINLPLDYTRPTKITFDGDIYQFEISKEETRSLHKIAHDHGESLYMVLFAIYNVLLNKLSGQEDVIVGTVTAGRGHEDLQNIVGMFLNTLALRNYPEGGKIFEDFLMEVKLTAFAAFDNQDYPFEQLVSQVAPRQEAGRNPLFDVAFGLENEADPTGYLMQVAIPDKSKPYDFGTRKAKFDMTLVCVEVEEGMECTIEYKTRLFKPQTVGKIVGYLQKIITSVCSGIRQKIGEIEIISAEEKQLIIHQFNETRQDYPKDRTIHEMFEECVEKHPDNIALSFPFQDKTMTYGEVNEKANQLARMLRGKGIKPDHLVGIMVERCTEMIVGIMGIIKSGGAYLPVDPNYPEDRIRYLFKDSSAKLLLTLDRYVEFAGTVDFDGEVMSLEDEALYSGDSSNISNVNKTDHLAYIIYTSGSTGKPKGVMIEHVAAVNLLLTLDRVYPLEAEDSYLLKTAFLFDVSVSEIFGWFWRGGRLSILEQGAEKDPLMIIQRIKEEGVTHLNFVPSMFNVFISMVDETNVNDLKTLRWIFLAGEAIWPDSVLKFRTFGTGTLIENLYGPTEATVYASWYPVGDWPGTGSVSIGKATDNLKLYILSSDNKAKPALQPVGIAGELTISGIQLARGYLNRPDLTTEMFVDNPFAFEEKGDKAFEKLYHTGDLCRWGSDGNVEYMGRIDHQVKVRGFRIELGEIESQLKALDEVEESIVIVRQDQEGEKYLCAYLMSGGPLDMTSIRKRLSENIPGYMVPSYFVQIEKIPLNPNGKLDRKALPEPEAEAFATEYAAPTNEIEERLAEVWAEVLGATQVGIDDNFFEIGGDSIKTIMISAKLQKQKLNVSINDFFAAKTIRALAECVTKVERKIDQGPFSGDVELAPIQRWFFEKDVQQRKHLHPVLLFHREAIDTDILEQVLGRLTEHHDALRMIFKIDKGRVVQENRGLEEGPFFDLRQVDYSGKEVSPEEFEKEAGGLREQLNLQEGPLLNAILFKTGEGDYLMMSLPAVICDESSLEILEDDFETAYSQVEAGEVVNLGDKTDAFGYWTQRLKVYADSPQLLEELGYWQGQEASVPAPLPKDHAVREGSRTIENREAVSIVLSPEETGQLLDDANWLHNTDPRDLLLTALVMTFEEWSQQEKVAVTLEGNARGEQIEDIDVSRTIGAFETQFPALFDMKGIDKGDSLARIQRVKEILRGIPKKGVGYGVLKHFTAQENKANTTFNLRPEIGFFFPEQLEE